MFRSRENLCGASAVWIAAARLGINESYESVVEDLRPWIYGSSLSELRAWFEERDIVVLPTRIDAKQLCAELNRKKYTCAIINLMDHWAVALKAGTGDLQVVDFPRKYFIPIADLDGLWEGETLLIARRGNARGLLQRLGAGAGVCLVGLACLLLCARRGRVLLRNASWKTGK